MTQCLLCMGWLLFSVWNENCTTERGEENNAKQIETITAMCENDWAKNPFMYSQFSIWAHNGNVENEAKV